MKLDRELKEAKEAAWTAACLAAWTAACLAARSAAWSAERSAARSAAWSAAWSAERSAAWSAAYSTETTSRSAYSAASAVGKNKQIEIILEEVKNENY
jgi:hypothetical protein